MIPQILEHYKTGHAYPLATATAAALQSESVLEIAPDTVKHSHTRLPGVCHDLVYLDASTAAADGCRVLVLALSQARFVVVGGYQQARETFFILSEFLLRYRDAMAYTLALPGAGGELLIAVDADYLAREQRRLFGNNDAVGSEAVREHYTEAYYREDCGGWESFRRHRAKRLDDDRLRSLFDLAMAGKPRRLLDLGCGRGEIAYQAARQWVNVTAVDYSPDAIAIARTCFDGEPPEMAARVEWLCASAADMDLRGEYDVAVAGDLVEHLSPAELDRMYATVARHLAPGGRLIVHTFPNAWHYRYHYARQRRTAASVGAYLSPEPRSRYEKLMHINEQSPRVLRRQLARHFPHVCLWFLQPNDPIGSLRHHFSHRELAACRDLYAVASREEIERAALVEVLAMDPLTDDEARRVRWHVGHCPAQARSDEPFAVTVRLKNGSAKVLHSRPAVSGGSGVPLARCRDRGQRAFRGRAHRAGTGALSRQHRQLRGRRATARRGGTLPARNDVGPGRDTLVRASQSRSAPGAGNCHL